MEKENQKILTAEIKPFLVDYLTHARAVIETRNGKTEFITKFVDRYNNNNILQKYKFQNTENGYVWTYKIDSIELKVKIVKVTDLVVTLKCERNGKVKEIELMEPPYADIYNTVYKFLIDTVENAITLEDAEANMKF